VLRSLRRGREVLSVRDVPMPRPGPGEALVEVRAAGINPGEALIRSGVLHELLPAIFPSGEGTDLAGIVLEIGADVKDFGVGDAVLGYSWTRSIHATHAVVPATQLISKPEALPWEVAGALDVAGTTAYAAVRAAAPGPGDVVVVSAATGGVGTLVVQLLLQRGATVLGIASASSAEWLTDHGVIAVEYGDGIRDRLRSAAPNGLATELQAGLGSGRAREGLTIARSRGQLRGRPPKLNRRQEHHIVGLYGPATTRSPKSATCSTSPDQPSTAPSGEPTGARDAANNEHRRQDN